MCLARFSIEGLLAVFFGPGILKLAQEPVEAPLSSGGDGGDMLQLLDSIAYRFGETLHFFRRGAGGLESGAKLLIADAADILQQPPHIVRRDAGRYILRLEALVAPLHDAILHAPNEFRGLRRVALAIPFIGNRLIGKYRSPLPHRAAPVREGI